jgi:hypothetical protein
MDFNQISVIRVGDTSYKVQHPHMKTVAAREQTFARGWPGKIDIQALVEAGFFFDPTPDAADRCM